MNFQKRSIHIISITTDTAAVADSNMRIRFICITGVQLTSNLIVILSTGILTLPETYSFSLGLVSFIALYWQAIWIPFTTCFCSKKVLDLLPQSISKKMEQSLVKSAGITPQPPQKGILRQPADTARSPLGSSKSRDIETSNSQEEDAVYNSSCKILQLVEKFLFFFETTAIRKRIRPNRLSMAGTISEESLDAAELGISEVKSHTNNSLTSTRSISGEFQIKSSFCKKESQIDSFCKTSFNFEQTS